MKRICERYDPLMRFRTPKVRVGDEKAQRKRILREEAIIRSYKACPSTINSVIADKLIKRGKSRGKRLCHGCYRVVKDNGYYRCDDCRKEQRKSFAFKRRLYYLANKEKFSKKVG